MHVFRKPLSASGRIVTRVVLLVALGIASVALTHCRMVGDNVTGVNVASVMKAKSCLEQCQNTTDNLFNAEANVHQAKLRNCNGDATCIQQENERDAAVNATIQAALVRCQNFCHQQGGGGVTP
jgi:hypothetical protein